MTETTTQALTPAEEYRRIRENRLAGQALVDFESPSGMKWKLRRPNIQQFIMSGTMPMDLAAKLAAASEAGVDAEKAFAELPLDDKIKTLQFSQAIVRYCAVVPKIVDVATSDYEVSRDDIEPDDFQALFMWAVSGGEAADQLQTFRSE